MISSVDGVLGRLIKAESCGAVYRGAEELAAILRRLYHNPDERDRLSKNASALYNAKFVAEQVYGEMADYIEEMAEGGK